jgi:hypothetical protein
MQDSLRVVLHYVFALIARDQVTGSIPVYVNNGTITGLKVPLLLRADFTMLELLPPLTSDQEMVINDLHTLQAKLRTRINGRRANTTIMVQVENGVFVPGPYTAEMYWEVLKHDQQAAGSPG